MSSAAATSKLNRGRGDAPVPTATAAAASSSSSTSETPGGGMRMGTRISLSALHRERLRLATDLGLPGTGFNPLPPMKPHYPVKPPSGDDLTLMETKSILPRPPPQAYVVQPSASDDLPFHLNEAESLSDSLMERFDAMEAVDSEPERRINCVTLTKDSGGKLGLKIAGTPCGIFVEELYNQSELRRGDRIVAINGRSLENVTYQAALDLIKKSTSTVQFIVSQVTTNAN